MSVSSTRGQIRTMTFGCRLNTFESQIMRETAEKARLDEFEGETVIVNSCAVTGEAVRQTRQAIRRTKKKNPDTRIIVTGCAAQTEPENFAAMAEVDLVLGNAEKMQAQAYRALQTNSSGPATRQLVGDIFRNAAPVPPKIGAIEGRSRAFVQVQNGCDHRCTFCVIPYGRGNSRSVPASNVVAQVHQLVAAGYREIVLTGVDMTSWGQDLDGRPRLGNLIHTVLDAVPDLPRLRLSSIDSVEMDPLLMEIAGSETRFMPHLHLSLQHGDNLILKRMKRRHCREDAIRLCEKLRNRRPELTFGADLIAGFPTETDAMFANTCELIDECGLTFLHVFPFSARPMTPAARMPQLERGIVKERAARLRAIARQRLATHLESLVGRTVEILAEDPGRGHCADFSPARFESKGAGGIFRARITRREDMHVRAVPLRDRESGNSSVAAR